MADGDRNDPYASFNFEVSVGGAKASFSEVSGLSTETASIPYRNGDEDITVRKLPGLKTFSNITLRRGLTKDDTLWKWRQTVLDGKTERRNGTISLLNEARELAMVWEFREGWPSRWEGPSMNATGEDVAIEALEITCEYIAPQS